MATDMQSLTLFFSLVTGFVALMLFIYWKTQKTYDGFSHWTWGSIILPLGFLLATVYPVFPWPGLIVIANILFILSAVLRLDGTNRFIKSQPLPIILYWILLPLALFFVYFTYVQSSFALKTLVSAIVIAPILFFIGIIAVSSKESENRIINYCFASSIFLCGFLEIFRTTQWLLNGYPSYTNVDNLTIAIYTSALLLDVLATGFFLMLNLIRSQQELHASEERYRTLSNNLPDYVIVHNGTRILYANPASSVLTGLTQDEMTSCPVANIIAPESRTEAEIAFHEVLVRRVPVTLERIAIQSVKGEKRICTVRRVPVQFQGETAVLSVLTDITDQVQAEEALRKSKEQLSLAIEGSGVGLWDWDIPTGKIQIDLRWAGIAGYTLEELTPFDVNALTRMCYFDDLKQVDETLQIHFRKETPYYEEEARVLHKDGHWVWVLIRGKVVEWDESGKPLRMSGTELDITDRKKGEEALRATNRKLNLLSSITRHDIRNQLTILQAYIQLSEEALDKPEELRRLLKKEQSVSETIGRQIGFTRDYEDLGVKTPFWQDMGEVARKAAVDLPLGNVNLDIRCLNLEIYADPLFEKVFFNLIDNSLRYGGDSLTAIRISGEKSGENLRIVFEDDGAGIRSEDKKLLFTKGFGKNTGLGLFLSREILSITNITISETGEYGKGARFEILVPKGEYRIRTKGSHG